MGLRLSANKENRVSSVSTLPEASERYQVLSHPRLSVTSERWENNLKGSKPQSFLVSRSRHQIKKYARDYYVAGRFFLMARHIFFLFTRRRLFTPPAPTPRTATKICLPLQNIPEPKFYFRCRPPFNRTAPPKLFSHLPTFPSSAAPFNPPTQKKEQLRDRS